MSAPGLPLAGRRILVTRPRAQSRPLCDRLRRLGAQPVAVPTIGIVAPRAGGPLDAALAAIERYDWVVATSANGARAIVRRARALGIALGRSHRPRWAALGPTTAAALRAAGVPVALVPPRFLTEGLAASLPEVAGRRILLPRTDAAGPALAEALRARGAEVDEVTAYRTVLAPARSQARILRLVGGREVDTVLFTSASTVRGLVRLLGAERDALQAMVIACIGPVTAAAAVEEGFHPAVVAAEHTADGLVAALVAHPGAHPSGLGSEDDVRKNAAR